MEQKPKRKNQQGLSRFQKIGIAVGMLFSLICIGILTYGLWELSRVEYVTGEKAPNRVEHILNVSLPNQAQYIDVAYGKWQNFPIKMRFSLPADVTELWLSDSGLCFDNLVETDTINLHLGYPNPDWWQLENVEKFVSDECGDDPYYKILIDQTDSEWWIIYIQVISS